MRFRYSSKETISIAQYLISGKERFDKIVAEKEWRAACQKGLYFGSEDDRRDGFIHLSSEQQVEGTAERFFKNQNINYQYTSVLRSTICYDTG